MKNNSILENDEDSQNSELGALLDEVQLLRFEKESHEITLKEIERKIDNLKQIIIAKMQEEGLSKIHSGIASATLQLKAYPSVSDMVLLMDFCFETKNYGLLQKRVNTSAYFEALGNGEDVKGVSVFEKYDLAVRRK